MLDDDEDDPPLAISRDAKGDLKQAADNLYWCLRERYTVRDGMIMKGGNELMNFYCRPDAEEARALAEAMETAVAPIRRRRSLELLDQIESLVVTIRADIS